MHFANCAALAAVCSLYFQSSSNFAALAAVCMFKVDWKGKEQ